MRIRTLNFVTKILYEFTGKVKTIIYKVPNNGNFLVVIGTVGKLASKTVHLKNCGEVRKITMIIKCNFSFSCRNKYLRKQQCFKLRLNLLCF